MQLKINNLILFVVVENNNDKLSSNSVKYIYIGTCITNTNSLENMKYNDFGRCK